MKYFGILKFFWRNFVVFETKNNKIAHSVAVCALAALVIFFDWIFCEICFFYCWVSIVVHSCFISLCPKNIVWPFLSLSGLKRLKILWFQDELFRDFKEQFYIVAKRIYKRWLILRKFFTLAQISQKMCQITILSSIHLKRRYSG